MQTQAGAWDGGAPTGKAAPCLSASVYQGKLGGSLGWVTRVEAEYNPGAERGCQEKERGDHSSLHLRDQGE